MISFRRSAVVTGIVATVLLLVLCLSAVILLFSRGAFVEQIGRLAHLPSQKWWMNYQEEGQRTGLIIWNLIGLSVFLIICAVLVMVVREAYNRTASAEVFFFLLFLFSLQFEALRGVNALLIHMGTPELVYRILTRAVLFGRFFGLICLLFSSVYAVGVQFQKFSTIIFSSAAAALILAYALPLDRSVILSTFLHRLGDEIGAWFAVLAVQFFVFINYLIAAIKRQNPPFFVATASVVAVLIGRELFLFSAPPLRVIVGLVLTTFGVLGFSRAMNRVYQWTG